MLEIHIPSQENRQEAFWYYGEHIATYTFADGTQLVLESSGEIEATMKFQSLTQFLYKFHDVKGEAAVRSAVAFDWTDENLSDDEQAIFNMNNWLAIRKLEPNTTEGPDDDVAICHTYSEGIQKLLEEAARILAEENQEENLDLDDEGKCLYCGQDCFEGEMCDEQQAGGFDS